uniref:Uncharacterized protein n=1 Tax=Timema genevievae TaxID=629358 RepID=A0A7R9PLI0_TIMGE|nr:unnamed protein product [Timema genevievae]
MLTLSHLDLPSTSASLRFEEVRHPKLTIPCMRRDVPGYTYIGTNDADTSMTPVRDGESYSGSATSDFMVIEVGNLGLVDHENALEETASGGNGLSRQRKFSGDLSNMKPGDEGIEMELPLLLPVLFFFPHHIFDYFIIRQKLVVFFFIAGQPHAYIVCCQVVGCVKFSSDCILQLMQFSIYVVVNIKTEFFCFVVLTMEHIKSVADIEGTDKNVPDPQPYESFAAFL